MVFLCNLYLVLLLTLLSVCNGYKRSCVRPVVSHTAIGPLKMSSDATPQYALLFDCDGVIVETEELHRLAYNKAFTHFGLKTSNGAVEWTVPYCKLPLCDCVQKFLIAHRLWH